VVVLDVVEDHSLNFLTLKIQELQLYRKFLLYFHHSYKHTVDKWSSVCNPFLLLRMIPYIKMMNYIEKIDNV